MLSLLMLMYHVRNKPNKLGFKMPTKMIFFPHCQKEQDPYSSGMDPSLPSPYLLSPRLGNIYHFSNSVPDPCVTHALGFLDLDPNPLTSKKIK